jgi:aminopeptidase N
MSRHTPSRGARAPWISPELARHRSQRIGALDYDFDLRIDARARVLSGRQCIALVLDASGASGDLVLDWRPGEDQDAPALTHARLAINGEAGSRESVRLRHGHLTIGARHLRAGLNRIELQWRADIRDAGGALTRFRDPVDGAWYVYTLFVPADASSVFPCFDQPDLKARFKLTLTVPADWQAIANAPLKQIERSLLARRFRFAATEPISTYLFAFAAGPFVALRSKTAPGALWVRRSQVSRAQAHREEVLALNDLAVGTFSRYFGHRLAFAKYDLVAIPEFPYRGMEHAGATFLAERDVFLPASRSIVPRWERAQLVFHETAHQWIGNLVTMRSFDDLWLKEGFANLMAYKLAARALPAEFAAVAFHRLKVQAYHSDQSKGATALHHPLPDVALAKSAYGWTVYARAPALLRHLESLLGPVTFQRGVRTWVRRHAYAAADWRDLVCALEDISAQALGRWARTWILRPGAPRVRIVGRDGRPRLVMKEAAYAIATYDAAAIEAAGKALARTRSALHRIQLWENLWQAVRDGSFDPVQFVALAIARLGDESNEMILCGVLQRIQCALDRLLDGERACALAQEIDCFLLRELEAAVPALRHAWIDGLVALVRTPSGCAALEALALGKHRHAHDAGTPIRRQAALMLVVRGAWTHAQAWRSLAPIRERAGALRLQLDAAQPDPASKARVFDRYLSQGTLADEIITASLDLFNHPAHTASTRPLLAPALRALPELYRRRKIFFVNRWIGAFVGGQWSPHAHAIVLRVLTRKSIDPHLRRKLMDAEHELKIAIDVRHRWTASLNAGTGSRRSG